MTEPTKRAKAIQRLEETKKSEPELASYYRFYQDMLQIQDDAGLEITAGLEMIDGEVLAERLHAGLPQLSFANLAIEEGKFVALVLKILGLLLEYQGKNEAPYPVDDDLIGMAQERFMLAEPAEPANLTGLAIDLASMPYLEHAAGQLKAYVDGAKWIKGSCPACGGEPNFSYLEAEDGSRFLVCARCRFEWRYKRTACPFCSSTDPQKLRYYPAGENRIYRLYVCDSCGRYLKAVDKRTAGQAVDLIAEPILTWSLDKAAREMNYR